MRRFASRDSGDSRDARRRAAQDDGFSTLEAIVAIGILGLCLLPILDFQASVSDGALRLQQRQREIDAIDRAESYLRSMPARLPAEGSVRLGELDVAWREINREVFRKSVSEQGAPGRFDVSLVRIDVTVYQGGREVGRRQLDRIEWTATASLFEE